MESREIRFPNSAWTILKKDSARSGVYLWQQPDFSAVFLLSSKLFADEVIAKMQLDQYIAYQFPDRGTLLKLLESMAEAGVTSVASDPGEVGPLVSPIASVISQIRALS